MNGTLPILLVSVLVAGSFGTVAIYMWLRRGDYALSRRMIALALMPALMTVALFFSLAMHVHSSLGGWPEMIGMEGFTNGLMWHANLATWVFGGCLLASLFLCPVAALAGSLMERFRPALPYVGIFAMSCCVSLGATSCAPPEFLYWWWD